MRHVRSALDDIFLDITRPLDPPSDPLFLLIVTLAYLVRLPDGSDLLALPCDACVNDDVSLSHLVDYASDLHVRRAALIADLDALGDLWASAEMALQSADLALIGCADLIYRAYVDHVAALLAAHPDPDEMGHDGATQSAAELLECLVFTRSDLPVRQRINLVFGTHAAPRITHGADYYCPLWPCRHPIIRTLGNRHVCTVRSY